jgi:hypothetical protein
MTVILAFLGDVVLAPALMSLAFRGSPPGDVALDAAASAPADALV